MKKSLIILGLQIVSLALHAQDFKETILKMQAEYTKLTSFHIVMRVQIFEDSKASTAFMDQIADVKQSAGTAATLKRTKHLSIFAI